MKSRDASEDSRSLDEVSISGHTNGNMSYISEPGFGSSTNDSDDKKNKLGSSSPHQDVAIREQKAVTQSKLLVALFLLLAACVTAAVTYLYLEQQERIDFEDQVSADRRRPFCPVSPGCCN